MANNWVLNASPVIVLAQINQENLLFNLADQIVLPQITFWANLPKK